MDVFGDEDPMEVDVPEKVVFGVDIGFHRCEQRMSLEMKIRWKLMKPQKAFQCCVDELKHQAIVRFMERLRR